MPVSVTERFEFILAYGADLGISSVYLSSTVSEEEKGCRGIAERLDIMRD